GLVAENPGTHSADELSPASSTVQGTSLEEKAPMPGPSGDDRLQAEARKLAEPTLGIGAHRDQRPNLNVGTDGSTEGIEAQAHPGENRSPGWLGNHRSDEAYYVQLGPDNIDHSVSAQL